MVVVVGALEALWGVLEGQKVVVLLVECCRERRAGR